MKPPSIGTEVLCYSYKVFHVACSHRILILAFWLVLFQNDLGNCVEVLGMGGAFFPLGAQASDLLPRNPEKKMGMLGNHCAKDRFN